MSVYRCAYNRAVANRFVRIMLKLCFFRTSAQKLTPLRRSARPINQKYSGPALAISLFGHSGKFATCHSRVLFVFSETQFVFTFSYSYSQLRRHAIGDRLPLLINISARKCFHNAHVCQPFWSVSAKSQSASDLDDLNHL
jgi:hypothetical protein